LKSLLLDFSQQNQNSMKRQLTALALSMTLLSACNNVEDNVQNPLTPSNKEISVKDLDNFILETLQKKGEFKWESATDQMVWLAMQNSEKVMSVGYKPSGETNIDSRLHEIDINASGWKQTREQIIEMVFEEEKKSFPDLRKEQLIAYEEQTLPVLDLNVRSFQTVQKLRASGLVRYAEPMAYQVQSVKDAASRVASSSGCGSNTASSELDFTTTTPSNAKVSWNYAFHGVQNAWNRTSGGGVKIVIIDTGSSDSQTKLGSQFNQGNSSGRTLEKLVTLPRATFLGIPTGSVETPNDGCGHGTSMIGAAAAPRGTDGTSIGVAYNTNLISIRAASDVFLDASRETKGVSDAFVLAGNRSDVRIISMSMGNIISSGQIADGVRYAYGKGKMIFCAGGTSFGWTAGWAGVIFPASMTEAIAVTGIKDNLSSRCDACHEGSDIEFVTVMERASNSYKPLSLAMSGNAPSTVGGSSVATASMAGMASLVWSRMQALGQSPDRTSVYNRLRSNASNANNRHPNFGWGRVNVDLATQ
jgi:hypothetical protein